jgi:hypothetical protein
MAVVTVHGATVILSAAKDLDAAWASQILRCAQNDRVLRTSVNCPG